MGYNNYHYYCTTYIKALTSNIFFIMMDVNYDRTDSGDLRENYCCRYGVVDQAG